LRFKTLSELKRPVAREIELATLPQDILITRYAMAKAFMINTLVHAIHHASFEWYGYTIANRDQPELIVDIGLPKNDQNIYHYTHVGPDNIVDFQEALPRDKVINGWIHSHGSLEYRHFSSTDERNHVTALDYVTTLLRKPVTKKELVIKDLVLLVKNQYTAKDLESGSVSLITDVPVTEARIMETVYGSFCYGIVIDDEGWHKQEIHYRTRGILSGQTTESKREANLILVDNGRSLTETDISVLRDEIKEKIQPVAILPPERFEKEAT